MTVKKLKNGKPPTTMLGTCPKCCAVYSFNERDAITSSDQRDDGAMFITCSEVFNGIKCTGIIWGNRNPQADGE